MDGWTVAAIWPELGGFNRMDRYLADSAGNVLTCKVGVQGGKVDPTTQADFCDRARASSTHPEDHVMVRAFVGSLASFAAAAAVLLGTAWPSWPTTRSATTSSHRATTSR